MIHHWSLFTKPWKTATAEELGALAARLGFTGIEFPLRAGYQVDLADAERGLVSLGKALAQYGVRITSVASDTSERAFAACQAAGVRILRASSSQTTETSTVERKYADIVPKPAMPSST